MRILPYFPGRREAGDSSLTTTAPRRSGALAAHPTDVLATQAK